MSLSTYQNKVNSLNRNISDLQRNLSREQEKLRRCENDLAKALKLPRNGGLNDLQKMLKNTNEAQKKRDTQSKRVNDIITKINNKEQDLQRAQTQLDKASADKRKKEELAAKKNHQENLARIKEAQREQDVLKEKLLENKKLEVDAKKLRLENNMTMDINWTIVYNRLFDLINISADHPAYFSGPRYLSIYGELISGFYTYSQFIDKRNAEGKSTSRRIYFYDLLMDLDDSKKMLFVNRILDEIETTQKDDVKELKSYLLGEEKKEETQNWIKEVEEKTESPKVFISYSWDDEEHKQWTLGLANHLRENGIETIIDQYYLKPGRNFHTFMEKGISASDKVIIVFTPNYKVKADNRKGGVGKEYSIINAQLYKEQAENERVVPILRRGEREESIPDFITQYIDIDFRNDDLYKNSFNDLVRVIFNKPEIRIPEIGDVPDFDNL